MGDPKLLNRTEHGMDAPQFRWPDEYEPLDDGGFFVRPDCVTAFRALGWNTLDDVMGATNLEVVRRLDARDNCRVKLPTESTPVLGYVKRHRVRSLRRRYLENGRHRAAESPGLAEANAAGWCHAAGVPALNVIAAGQRLLGKGRSDSFFISQDLSGCAPANDHWFSFELRANPPANFASEPERRLATIRTVAQTARRFHEANLFHSDFYLEHFFVSAVPEPTAHLVDLQRVQRLEGVARQRALIKDLCQLHGSFNRYRLTEVERNEFLAAYAGCEGKAISVSTRLHMKAAIARWNLRRFRRTLQKRGKRAA